MKHLLTIVTVVSFLPIVLANGCATAPSGGPDCEMQASDEQSLELLAQWMTRTFSSEAQPVRDPENYYNIRLVMMPIWEDRADGPWLYVEQAAASALDRPYRQRVYQLQCNRSSSENGKHGEETLASVVYTIPDDPLRFAGAWRKPGLFDSITPDDLSLRDGCTVYLSLDAQSSAFVGSTDGTGCASSLGGAAYATSEVSITPIVLTSWDRGFDVASKQVWGATEGPYEFIRIADATSGEQSNVQ